MATGCVNLPAQQRSEKKNNEEEENGGEHRVWTAGRCRLPASVAVMLADERINLDSPASFFFFCFLRFCSILLSV
jgi:hypothetical protein